LSRICQADAQYGWQSDATRRIKAIGRDEGGVKADLSIPPLGASVSRTGEANARHGTASPSARHAMPLAASGTLTTKHPFRPGPTSRISDGCRDQNCCEKPSNGPAQSINTVLLPQRATKSIRQNEGSTPKNRVIPDLKPELPPQQPAPRQCGAGEAAEFPRSVRSPRCFCLPSKNNTAN